MTDPPNPSSTVLERETTELKRKPLTPWNVVLLDDNDHTYDYVINMLRKLFRHSAMDAFRMAQEVDQTGRVIVLTTHRELAELEMHRIHTFGADPRITRCKGSMTAIIEPAQGS